MKLLFLLPCLYTLTLAAKVRHGQERFVIQHEDNSLKKVTPGDGQQGMKQSGMEFKSFSGNESESMFQTVKGDDMNITMQEANITTNGYVSDDVKEQQQFHHYNNTNFFVTFRDTYLK